MNNQVKQYFTDLRIMKIENSIIESMNRKNNFLKIVNESVGTEVNLNIDDEDIKWVNIVRRAFYVQNKYKLNQEGKRQLLTAKEMSQIIPPSHNVLALRYALLAQGTRLHRYEKKWNPNKKTFEIYEILNVGGGKNTKRELVAQVNNAMRQLYANFHHKPFVNNSINNRKKDGEIADWWIEYNENSIQTYIKPSAKNKKPNGEINFPKPFFKIVGRKRIKSKEFIDLIYLPNIRSDVKIKEIRANNIPIDIDSFRSKAEAEGYRETSHAQNILRYSRWVDFLDSDATGKGGSQKFIPSKENTHQSSEYMKIIKRKPGGLKNLKPGYLHVDENVSKTFMNLYKNQYTFHNAIEISLLRALKSSLLKFRNVLFTYNFIPTKHKNKSSEIKVHHSYNKSEHSIDEQMFKDMLSKERIIFFNKTGKIKDEDWKQHWKALVTTINNKTFIKDNTEFGKFNNEVFKHIFASAQYTINQELPIKLRKRSIMRGQGQTKDEEGTSKGFISGISATSQENDPSNKNLDDFTKLGSKIDYKPSSHVLIADEERKERIKLIKSVLQNPEILKKKPQILQNVKKIAQEDPSIKELLLSWDIDIDNISYNQDKFSINYTNSSHKKQDLIGTAKQFDHYSFANYVKKRINENNEIHELLKKNK